MIELADISMSVSYSHAASGTEQSIRSAMAYIESRTCIKFVPWTENLKEELDLPHNDFVRFVSSGG